MRTSISVLASTLVASHAMAAEIPTLSRVDGVTVFLSGAEVTRVAKVKVEKGQHVLIFDDVPASAVPGSIRVEGKATGKFDIGSVDTQRKLLARADSQAADLERKKIEDEIEALRDQKTSADAMIQAAETQKNLIANLAQLPTRPAPNGVSGGEDWVKVLALIPTSTVEANKILLDAQIKARDFDRKIQDLEKKLVSLAPPKTEQTEVKVYVDAGSALEADMTIRYQISEANWTPIYDARLKTGSKTEAPSMELSRRAAISQRSGETWDNVTLQLSTTRPSEGAQAPLIDTQFVNYEPEFKPPVPVANLVKPTQGLRGAAKYTGLAQDEMVAAQAAPVAAEPEMAQPVPAPMAETAAVLTSAPFDATFSVPGKVTITGNGEAKRVVLMTEQTEPKISIRTVPRTESNAYLYAKLQLAKGTPLLPGKVYLFRDGTFVGTGDLPMLPTGDEHDLGFGKDDQVKVKFATLDDKRGQSGFISTSRIDNRSFRVTVKNLHERPVDLVVFDRIPVSQNQDIKVEATGKSAPTKQNVDEKRGVINFEAPLAADEEKVLEYGYRVSWPAAKSITYSP